MATCVLAIASSASALIYSVQDLGDLTNLAGQTKSTVNAINSAGKVIGIKATNGNYRAQLHSLTWSNLGTLGGAASAGNGINDSNLVVGSAVTASGSTHAFLWTPGATNGIAGNLQMKDLGTLGGSNSEACAINSIGQICGYSQVNGNGNGGVRERAFRSNSNGTMTDIGVLTGYQYTYAYGINDLGHVAGTAYEGNGWRGFVYDGVSATSISDTNYVALSAINNSDCVTGYLTETNNYFTQAFTHRLGKTTHLGTLGGNYAYAFDINNSNAIVGGSFTDTGNTIYHAFICLSDTLLDLNNLVDSSGDGWTLQEARGINDAGQITGTGYYNSGTHAFLLTPVTPSLLPVISLSRLAVSNLIVSFTTQTATTYSLQTSTNLDTGSWSTLVSDITGTGSTLTLTNIIDNLTETRRFYRILVTSP